MLRVTCFAAVFDFNGFTAVTIGFIVIVGKFFQVIEIALDVLVKNQNIQCYPNE